MSNYKTDIEMKDIKEQILEMAQQFQSPTKFGISSSDVSLFVSEIEVIVKENYVEKEFVEWMGGQDIWHCSPNTWNVVFNKDDKDRLMSNDELHDYWLKEIKK